MLFFFFFFAPNHDDFIDTTLDLFTAAAQDTISEEVKETRQELKGLFQKKVAETQNEEIADLIVEKFEEKPTVWRSVLKDELIQAKAEQDKAIVKAVEKLATFATPKDAAFDRIASTAHTNRKQLEQIYEQRKWQSSLWTYVSVAAASIGFLVIIGGIIVAFIGSVTAGLITSASGLITEGVAALFFQQVNAANTRVDSILEKLLEIDKSNRALEIALTSDDVSQDRLKEIIMSQMLGLPSQNQREK